MTATSPQFNAGPEDPLQVRTAFGASDVHAARHRVLKRVALLLPLVGVLAMFLPTLPFEFLAYDEQHQLLGNPLVRSLAWENLARIFTSFSITNYYPVRVLSFAIDYAVWDMYPEGFRLTNVLLHAGNTMLLFALVRRLARPLESADDAAGWWACAAAAGLFALHPVVVEPVVWIAGREELLMIFFTLACLHLHVRAGETQSTAGAVVLHALTAIAAAFACMSNVAAVAIPLLVLAYDLASRRSVGRTIAGGWPLWLIATGAIVAKKMGDRVARDLGVLTEEGLHLDLAERIRAILDGYWLNLKGLAWPSKLVAIYPKTVPDSFASPTVVAGALLAVGTLLLIWAVRRSRLAFIGLLWFVVGLAPSAQVIPHHIHHADRFLYLPLIGLAVAAAAAVRALLASRAPRFGSAFVLVAAFAAMTVVTARQSRVWRNTETLFAHNVAIYPDVADARNNLGLALADRGDWHGSREHLSRAAELMPADADVQFNLGMVYRYLGTLDAAAGHLEESIRLHPSISEAHYRLAEVRMDQHRTADAIACLRAELKLNEEHADAHNLLGLLLAKAGKETEAAKHYRRALKLRPGWPSVANNLAWLLATAADAELRDGAESVRLAEAAVRATGGMDPQLLDTLAAAYAESARFDEAVAAAEQALDLAKMQEDNTLTGEVEARLALFRAHRSYHATPTTSAAAP